MENNNDNQCECVNNYTSETFFESFGVSESEMKNCNGCSHFEYDNGICTCKLFNK